MPRRGARALEFLTIVTFGRSGSTALQAVLNAHPQTVIRGENYLAMRGLQAYVQALAAAASRHHSGRPDHPWFGTARLDARAAREGARRMFIDDVLRPRPDTVWSGYKEVRYETGYFPDPDSLLDHLLFVASFLPGVRFLINIRSAEPAVASGWWPDNPRAAEVVRDTIGNLRSVGEDLRSILGQGRVVSVDYEQWSVEPSTLCSALTSIGFPVNAAVVRQTLATHLDHGRSRGHNGQSRG